MRSQELRLSIFGFILGLGSALGWLLIRWFFECHGQGGFQWLLYEWDQFKGLYVYLMVGTTFFFSLFGFLVGHLLEKVMEKDLLLEIKTQDYMKIIGLVSHELRTPLTSIKGRLDLALSERYGEVGGVLRANLFKAKLGCDQINHMISSYLNLARIEKGELNVKVARLDLFRDVIFSVVDEVAILLENQRMKIEFKGVSKSCHYWLKGDSQWLKVVFRNLFSNAIRYGYQDTVVEVRIEDLSLQWKIEVFNFGHGVPADYSKKIFDRFEKVPRKGEIGSLGTGLGLYIVKAVIEQHGGQIRCESELGKWANFIITLPKAEEQIKH